MGRFRLPPTQGGHSPTGVGGYDYLLKFLCRSVADYQDTVERMLSASIQLNVQVTFLPIFDPVDMSTGSIHQL